MDPEEKKKLDAEGCCYNCKKQGHMSRNCPTKAKKPSQSDSKKVRAAETEEEAAPPYDKTEDSDDEPTSSNSMTAKIRKMTATQKESLFNMLMEEGF